MGRKDIVKVEKGNVIRESMVSCLCRGREAGAGSTRQKVGTHGIGASPKVLARTEGEQDRKDRL